MTWWNEKDSFWWIIAAIHPILLLYGTSHISVHFIAEFIRSRSYIKIKHVKLYKYCDWYFNVKWNHGVCCLLNTRETEKKFMMIHFYEVPAIKSFRELVTTRLRKTLPDNSGWGWGCVIIPLRFDRSNLCIPGSPFILFFNPRIHIHIRLTRSVLTYFWNNGVETIKTQLFVYYINAFWEMDLQRSPL